MVSFVGVGKGDRCRTGCIHQDIPVSRIGNSHGAGTGAVDSHHTINVENKTNCFDKVCPTKHHYKYFIGKIHFKIPAIGSGRIE